MRSPGAYGSLFYNSALLYFNGLQALNSVSPPPLSTAILDSLGSVTRAGARLVGLVTGNFIFHIVAVSCTNTPW